VAKDVVMPALGMAQDTGRILRWIAAEGSEVRRGDALLEIETDKVTVEIEAPSDGVLSAVSAGEGEDVPVGQVIARILAPGEEPGKTDGTPTAEPQVTATEEAETAAGDASGAQPSAPPRVPAASGTAAKMPSPVQRRRASRAGASPKARRLAAEAGVDISSLQGTGPGGAVVADDLPAVARNAAAGDGGASPTAPAETIPVSPAWKVMADRTTASWTSAPHFALTREISAERLMTWLQRIRARSPGPSVTVTDVILRVVVATLSQHPRLNGRWSEEGITAGGPVNLGLAVATDDGLVVPVIAGAERLSVEELAERRRDLVDRARSGGLRPADVQGGTFTVTNLGMFGVDSFTAVINPPQAAILAVGRIAERPVAEEGQVVVRPRITLTISCDHRVVDGAGGARFLATLADLLEEPLGLFG
jgi:pyruvate dehydrogenase E2 component (dihydrolipoamide acetyltransferase)